MNTCRACAGSDLTIVLDLGITPAADCFPLAAEPISAAESAHPLAMALCGGCGLAQLADDDTETQEPRGVEPQALVDQARAAVGDAATAGLLRGSTATEFGSPHGGTWLPHLTDRGYRTVGHDHPGGADVVIDSLGIMHDADQAAAVARRAAATAPGGVLLLHYLPIATIVRQGQWNALRHGHFAYYSMPAMVRLLAAAGMSPVTAHEYDLYGGTVVCAAVHGNVAPDSTVTALLERDAAMGDPAVVAGLQRAADTQIANLRSWLAEQAAQGHRVLAYGAASRAVASFCLAGLDRRLVAAVGDAAPAKRGRRMPGTDIPIVSPAEFAAAQPDRILLTVPDLYREVAANFPELAGRWYVDDPEHGVRAAQ
ncbi:MAG: methyltransferase domain-containing protein [Gordonia sp. (in: high G+C Gram-positive bacteria)]